MSGPAEHAIRYALAPVVLLVALAAAGCGSTVQEGSRLTVYASLPPGATAEGAEQALADAGGEAAGAEVALEALDPRGGEPAGSWVQATVAANARAATQDSTSIAYIGELSSDATLLSAPITNEAGLLQLSPGPVAEELLAEPGGNDVPIEVQTTGERTLGTLVAEGSDGTPAFEYGYETMAVILDAIERAEDPLSRADVTAAYLATEDRDSELGTYSVGPDGSAVFEGGAPGN